MHDNIYVNLRTDAGDKSDVSVGDNPHEDNKTYRTKNIMERERAAITTAGSRCVKLTGVYLGLMCVLLLPAITALPVESEKEQLQQLQASYEKLKEERDQLQARYKNITTERDQLQTSYNSLMIEKNQLQTIYNNLMTEKDQLQSSYNELTVKRDQLQTSYNNLETEKDQLQEKMKEITEEHDKLETNCIIVKILLTRLHVENQELKKSITDTGCIRVGDRVKVKASVSSPKHGWGEVSHKSVGVVTAVDGVSLTVNFPEDSSWNGVLSEMEQASSADSGYFRTGDRVKVKASVTTPKYEWGEASHKSVGVVRAVSGERMIVDFPDHKSWLAATSEMELAPSVGSFRVGDVVRVKASVTTPKYKWGHASHKSLGVVRELDDGNMRVDFPEHKSWKGAISEMELVAIGDSELCKFKIGDKIHLKTAVGSPDHSLGAGNPKNVGTIKALKIVVDFPGRSDWTADLSEIEWSS